MNTGGGRVAQDSDLLKPSSDMLDLRALEEIGRDPTISQRDLARRLGVALGFANACIKNMARRGYIKFSRAKGNKLSYLITPAGLKARAALARRAFAGTVSFYAQAKGHIRQAFDHIAGQGARRIAFFGIDDLLDIILIVAQEYDFQVLAVVDPDGRAAGAQYLRIPVVACRDLPALKRWGSWCCLCRNRQSHPHSPRFRLHFG